MSMAQAIDTDGDGVDDVIDPDDDGDGRSRLSGDPKCQAIIRAHVSLIVYAAGLEFVFKPLPRSSLAVLH